MEIVHIAAELAPIAKVGGLGDVLLGLTRALVKEKHLVEIILPKYECLNLNGIENLAIGMPDLSSYFNGAWHHNTVWHGVLRGVPIALIESHDPYGFFERQTIYGCEDDVERFLYFCRVALEYLHKSERRPDILHLHDWHTGLIPLLQETVYGASPLSSAKKVFTIHNLAYQGLCEPSQLDKVGIEGKTFDHLNQLRDDHQPHILNLLKGGIVYSDFVTTVSPTYASEVLTEEGGMGLNRTLNKHKDKFVGILNGIDYEYWNPTEDPHIPFHFSMKEGKGKKELHSSHTKEKKEIQSHIRQILSLAEEESPLVCAVTRLVPQKGPDLIKYAMLKTLEKGGQFILLGSALDPKTHEEFHNLKRKFAGSRHLHFELTYNETLSHLVYAAADLFLIPSLFEPCGLTQMIAMRYGAVPLVRRTGGLADTVFEGENGYCFDEPTAEAINNAVDRALSCWFENPKEWQKLVENGMKMDFSWEKPAAEYVKLYKKIGRKHAHTN